MRRRLSFFAATATLLASVFLTMLAGASPVSRSEGFLSRGRSPHAIGAPTFGKMSKSQTSFDGDLRKVRLVRGPVKTVTTEVLPRRQPYSPVKNTGGDAAPIGSGTSPGANPPAPSSTSFDGLRYGESCTGGSCGGGYPPDTNGDVGTTYFIQSVNSSIGIYEKATGTRVVGSRLNNFMSLGNFGNICDTSNRGDPVVLYDTFEDRWIISNFAFTRDGSNNIVAPVYECFAVSKTGDPVTGGWNYYSLVSAGGLNDYPKLGIWNDGIYMSANMFDYAATGGYQNSRAWAINKFDMYAGEPAVRWVSFNTDSTEFTLLPSNARLQTGTPPAGSPNYFASVWNYLNVISIWKFSVNWESPGLSTFTGPFDSITSAQWAYTTSMDAVAGGSGANNLETLAPRLMMQNQYTNIGGVESVWNSHTVQGSTTTQPAVRYYQVKVTSGNVESAPTQAATYNPDATNRYMPSVAVNRLGDMAIGYTASSSSAYPSLRYAGRLAGDAVNTITQTETVMLQGGGGQSGTCGTSTCTRWGDYSTMTLDPDGCTFWFTSEYYATSGLDWRTRIGSFRYSGCTPLSGSGGTVSGTVTNASGGTPISGAKVWLGSRSTTTAANGTYSFTGIAAGMYPKITAECDGFYSSSLYTVTVTNGGTTGANFSLSGAPGSGCLTDTTQSDFAGGETSSVDTSSTPGSVKLDSGNGIDQNISDSNNQGLIFSDTNFLAQSFTAGRTGTLQSASASIFCASCSGSNPNLIMEIRTTAVSQGNRVPVMTAGGLLASSTITGTSSGAASFLSFSFASPPSLTSGTIYAAVIKLAAARTGSQAWLVTASGFTTGEWFNCTTSACSAPRPADGRDLQLKTYMQSGYATSATLSSTVKDSHPATGYAPTWSTISWTATTPTNTSVKFQVAGSNSVTGPFTFIGPDGTASTYYTTSSSSLSQFKGKRYLRYQAYLATTDTSVTPTLADVSLCYSNTVIQAQATALAVSAVTGTYGGTVNLSATLTSESLPVSGKSISFTLQGSSVGSATTNASGVATLSSVSLGTIAVGSYATDIAASWAGDGSYTSSSGTASLTVNKATATLTIAPSSLAQYYDGSPKPVTVTTSPAGLTTVSVTYNGSSTAPSAVGSYPVVASLTNSNYQATNATGTLVISMPPTLTKITNPFALGGSNIVANPSSADGLYLPGTVVSLTATTPITNSGIRYVFSSWLVSPAGAISSGCTTNAAACSITMSYDVTVTANYTTQYKLTLAVSGCPLSTDTTNISGGVDGTFYNSGVVLSLTASTIAGVNQQCAFSSWTGDGTGTPTRSVTMEGPVSITANYTNQYKLTLALTGCSFDTSTTNISGGADGSYYNSGTVLSLTAGSTITGTGQRCLFSSWTGDGTGTPTRSVTMSAARSVTATYTMEYQLTLTVSGCAVSSSTTNISGGTNNGWYAGDALTLSATTPISGTGQRCVFSSWTGDGTGSTAASRSITMNAARSVTANYTTEYQLTLAVSGCAVSSSTTNISGGTNSAWYSSGTGLALAATTPIAGTGQRCVFSSWTGDGTGSTAASRSVTMSAARSVTATYTMEYQLTLAVSGCAVSSSTSNITGGANGGWYAGDALTLSAITPITGTGQRCVFASWTGDGANSGADRSVTMSAARSVTANYTMEYQLTLAVSGCAVSSSTANISGGTNGGWYTGDALTLSATTPIAGTGQRCVFASWTGDGSNSGADRSVTMSAARSVTANYTMEYQLTLTVSGCAVSSSATNITGGTNNAWYPSGTALTLSATTPITGTGQRCVFSSWTGDGTGSTAASRSITMSAARSVTVTYTMEYQLTLAVSGCAVSSSDSNVNGGSNNAWYASGTGLTLSATTPIAGTGQRCVFSSWTGDGTGSTAASRSVTMSAARSVTATYSMEYQLTLAVSGCALSSNTTNISGGTNNAWYASGTALTLSATTPISGTGQRCVFSSWTGDGSNSGPDRSVAMSAARSITANYTMEYQLTLAVSGCAVSSSTANISGGTNNAWYASGTALTLSATTPISGTGQRCVFSSWTGDGSGATAVSRSITMSAARSVTATYTMEYQLTLTVSGCALTSDTSNIAGGTNGGWYAGDSLVLSATTPISDVGQRCVFASWSGNGSGTTAASRSITMSAARSVTANYTTQYLLSLSLSGCGFDSDPANITGGTDGTYYDSGTALSLTATPTISISNQRCLFSSWSGDGTGAPTRSVTMSAPAAITANYTTQYKLSLSTNPPAVGTSNITGATNGTFYDPGTFVTLSATVNVTVSGTPYTFSSWSGDGTGSTASSRVVTMDAARSVVANYATSTVPSGCTITGTGGDDVLDWRTPPNGQSYVSSGSNKFCGLGGNDIFIVGPGNDTVDGGGGSDTISFATAPSGVVLNLIKGSAASYGTDLVVFYDGASTCKAGISSTCLSSIENITGSAFADTLTGDSRANLLLGSAGADKLYGLDGKDTLLGGDGNDTLFPANGADMSDGGNGTDMLNLAALSSGVTVNLTTGDSANGGTVSGIENITGTAFADVLTGDDNVNLITPGAGDDVALGMGGNDKITESGGLNLLSGGDGVDTITGSTGSDTIYGDAGDDIIFVLGGTGVSVDGGDGIDLLSFGKALSSVTAALNTATMSGAVTGTVTAVENLIGSRFDDTLSGDVGINSIKGGDGDDNIRGGSGNDALQGGNGDDIIRGGAGADAVNGGNNVTISPGDTCSPKASTDAKDTASYCETFLSAGQ